MNLGERMRAAELAFLNAPFEEHGWVRAVQQLAWATDSRAAQLCATGGGAMLALNLFSDTLHDPYQHLVNPALYGPQNWRVGVTLAARTIEHELHYAAYRATHCTDYYDDAISDLDLPFGCQSALLLDANGMTGLALLRSRRDGPCTEKTLSAFARVAYQAQRAVRVQLALGDEAAQLMLGTVDERWEATVLLDGYANVTAMSAAAEALFEEPAGLRLHGLQLRLSDPDEDRAMASAMSRLLASDGVTGPVLHQMRFGRSAAAPRGQWQAVVVRIGGGATGLHFDPHLAVTVRPAPAA